MAILGGLPLLHCQSIDNTLDFYLQCFQFVVVNKREQDGNLNWVHIMHGDISLMLQAVETAETTSAQNSISLYFFVDNLDDQHHLIQAKNYPVSAIKETDYRMREFTVTDPEGNPVIVGQKLT